jgi:signal transduction histidine kinase
MKFGMRIFFLFVLAFIIASPTDKAAAVVPAPSTGFSPEAGIELISDSSMLMRISDILADTSRFTKHAAKLGFKEGENVFWARFRLSNAFDSDQEFLLFFATKWEYVEFYSGGKEPKLPQITGAHVALEKRTERNPYSAVSLKLRKGETQVFYVRLSFQGIWQKPGKVFSGAQLKTEYLAESGEEKFIQALFIGSLLIMALYNLMLFFSLKDKSYLFYVIMILVMDLTYMANYRFDFEYLFGSHPLFFQYLIRLPIYNLLAGPSVIIFAQSFLNTRVVLPRLHKVMNVFMGMILLFIIPCMLRLPDSGWFISDMSGLAVVSVCVLAGILAWRKGYHPAKFYLIASVFSCLGILIFLLESNFHLLPFHAKTYPMEFGMGLELFLYSFALSDKITYLKTEVNKQQEHTIFQLKENEKLKDTINRELVEKNRERERISKDIHDELGAGLSKIRFIADSLQAGQDPASDKRKAGAIREIALDLTDNMRDLIQMFSRSKSSIGDLLANLREYASDYLEDFPLDCTFYFPEEIPEIAISSEIHRQCFLICKEALHNIVKHSDAGLVIFWASYVPATDMLELRIEDNGCGLSAEPHARTGHGLVNMKQRASGMGASLEITSEVGKGCTVSVQLSFSRQLPCFKKEHQQAK